MKPAIRHRRLYAFYQSKVLNSLVITIEVCVLLMCCTQTLLLPGLCAGLALLFFIGYSLWLWIKKPGRIVINNWLANICSWYTLYFLIVCAMKSPAQWWYIMPLVCAVAILFIALITSHDETFEI